jgi:glycosyltransferase involved in cell wall biosynthesis
MAKRSNQKKKKNNKKNVNQENDFPNVSVLTPVYNRNKWLPMMLSNIINFDYDKEKIEWFILDSKDGDEEVKLIPDEFTKKNIEKLIHPIKLRYEYIPRKMTIAEKRTYLSKNMSNPWFANMDSDDIYMDCFLKYGIQLCKKNKVGLCGSPQMIFIYPHLDYRVTAIECSAKRQMHEATMIGTKKYLRSMNYYTKNDEKGEGASLVDGNEHGVIKSECALSMICVCHNTNTCNKDAFEGVNIQDANITGVKRDLLEQIMKDEINEGKINKSKFTIPEQKKNIDS